MIPSIHILNASLIREHDLDNIAHAVQRVFGLPVHGKKIVPDINLAFDSSRGQYNSTALLAQILSNGNPKNEKQILVVDVDLYIPVLTFVFGEAQLGGTTAIVSTHRLRNQFYGLRHDDGILLERLEKEIVHELGHTFGLYHCHQFECVMRSSTYVEEIDLKLVSPCEECKKILQAQVSNETHSM